MKKIYLSLFLLTIPFIGTTQLVVNNTAMTPTQLVQNILVGGGVTVSNVTLNGVPANSADEKVGSFNGTASNIGLANGVILGSGDVQAVAPGPNNSGGFSSGGSGATGVDPDLQAITPNQIYDECILEFDFVPAGDTVKFRYVFASEEYDEYVCGTVNDAFGFFISGPGILGPYTNNAENIAIIPGTSTAVSINTVNLGVPGFSGPLECDNIDPNWPSYNIWYNGTNTQNSVQYDGWTVVMTAISAVQCGQTYHIKLAIGDAGDPVWDSGVFLEAGSFSSNSVSISAATVTGDSVMVEGCGTAIFTFSRPDTSQAFTINFNIGGTATPGSDYTAIPDSIIIPQGSASASVIVDAYFDGMTEPTETITFFITYDNGCGPDTVEATIYINNVDPLQITATGPAEPICTPDETATLLADFTGGYGVVSLVWDNSAGVGDSVIVIPVETTIYSVIATDTCGNTDTASVEVVIQCDIIIPNVFSPNDDGVNDTFFMINLDDYPNSHLEVYNRWGQIVYESDNYLNNWNGGTQPDGVYYYILTTTDPDQGPFAGNVTILR